MLVPLGIFFLLLLVLFLLTKQLTNLIFQLFLFLTRQQKTAIILLTALLLPGTTIHELSHLFAAFVLRVPAGKLTVIPKIVPPTHGSGGSSPPSQRSFGEVKEVHAGSVMVGKTDPFRLTLIGLAPLPIGIALLYAISLAFFPSFFEPTTTNDLIQRTIGLWPKRLMTCIGIYLLSTISCSMFSSKKDLQALLISGPVVIVAICVLYWGGVRIGISAEALTRWSETIRQVNGALGITAGIDGLLVIILLLPQYLARLLRRR